jgi:hypothetical protein
MLTLTIMTFWGSRQRELPSSGADLRNFDDALTALFPCGLASALGGSKVFGKGRDLSFIVRMPLLPKVEDCRLKGA